jgi:hypothetical protein
MAQLFGALDIKDTERPFTTDSNRRLIWDEMARIFQQWNQDLMDATRLFVQGDTDVFQERYELPGGGELQEEAFEGTRTAEVKRAGFWDVGYPLYQYGASIAWNDVAMAYLTMGQFEATVQTVLNQNNNTVFRLILQALFRATPATYTDKIHGAVTIQPLANGDAVLYPPRIAATAEATETFLIAPNYTEATISDANDPFKVIQAKLEPYFGFAQGGGRVLALVASSIVPYARTLTNFIDVPYWNVQTSTLTDVPREGDVPNLPRNARVVGVCDGVTVAEWPRMPTGWIVGLHQDTMPPLKRRVDPPETGLASGLRPLTETYEHPFRTARWRNRLGYAVGNRLGAVVVALNGTTGYTVPAAYQ